MHSLSCCIYQGFGVPTLHFLFFLFTTGKYIFPYVVRITQLLGALIDRWLQICVCVYVCVCSVSVQANYQISR